MTRSADRSLRVVSEISAFEWGRGDHISPRAVARRGSSDAFGFDGGDPCDDELQRALADLAAKAAKCQVAARVAMAMLSAAFGAARVRSHAPRSAMGRGAAELGGNVDSPGVAAAASVMTPQQALAGAIPAMAAAIACGAELHAARINKLRELAGRCPDALKHMPSPDENALWNSLRTGPGGPSGALAAGLADWFNRDVVPLAADVLRETLHQLLDTRIDNAAKRNALIEAATTSFILAMRAEITPGRIEKALAVLRVGGDIGAVKEETPWYLLLPIEVGLGLIPVLGQVLDVLDLAASAAELQSPDAGWLAVIGVLLSAAAFVPLGGDVVEELGKVPLRWLKKAARRSTEVVRKTADEAATRLLRQSVDEVKAVADAERRAFQQAAERAQSATPGPGHGVGSPHDPPVGPSAHGGTPGTQTPAVEPANTRTHAPEPARAESPTTPDVAESKGAQRTENSRNDVGTEQPGSVGSGTPRTESPEVPPASAAADVAKSAKSARRKAIQPKARRLVRAKRSKLKEGVHEMPDRSRIHIDAQGRTTRVEVDDLRTDNAASRRKHLEAQVGHVGGEGFEGGHLHGRQFGGASEVRNLVPMHANANRRFLAIEQELAGVKQRGGDVVAYRVEVEWGGSPDVPESFIVRFQMREPGGPTRTIKKFIENAP